MKTEEKDKFEAFRKSRRNDLGLFDHLDYPSSADGFIDWRKMIPKEFLFVNEAWFKERSKDIPEKIEDCDDSQILIKLAGIKWLAKIRGFTKVDFDYQALDGHGCIATCTINWIPNFENPEGTQYTEVASCRDGNAEVFAKSYSESIAANRAFVRCVRNFLGVNIVGEEEVSSAEVSKEAEVSTSITSASKVDPQSIFIKLAKEAGMNTEAIIEFVKKNCEDLTDNTVSSESELAKFLSVKSARKLIKLLKT